MRDLNDDLLVCAVDAIWLGTGQTPPAGTERHRAVTVLRATLTSGAAIPRQTDKTVMPMSGPRTDIG